MTDAARFQKLAFDKRTQAGKLRDEADRAPADTAHSLKQAAFYLDEAAMLYVEAARGVTGVS